MRTTSFCLVFMLSGSVASAQRSVMIEDLTTTEVHAAIAGGKTTAFLYVGGAHENQYSSDEAGEDAVAIGKHNIVANYVARRVAEELGNALAVALPLAPNGDAIKKTGHMRFAGTVSLTEGTFASVCRDVAVSLIAAGFKHVVLAGVHGGGQAVMKKVADELDSEWSSKGVRVFFFPVYAEAKKEMNQHLTKMHVAENRHTRVEDAAEVISLDQQNEWVRKERLSPDLAKVVSPQLGKILIDQKINLAVKYIRSHVANLPGQKR